ncbi:hypothetical protein BDZ85DRAFT_264378 [Elsinoe ampelina]|uniref:N-acetyltransferase domain-containing protein n=1 Tax=Elsinoe ampelina TaxID=302913 RepID=A0A6A6G7X8_9PEZI|nr:hypothetical protein BDZ85DRAFT_264378 [Elsinoe ampelina]
MKGFVRYVRDGGMYGSVQTGTGNPRARTSDSGPVGGSGSGTGSGINPRIEMGTGAGNGKGKKHHALLGAVHESTAQILHSFGILDPEFVDGRKGGDGLPERYSKWIFDLRGSFGEGVMGGEGVERLLNGGVGTGAGMGLRQGAQGARGKKFSIEDTLLPDGLVWGEVRERDYALVRSRTGIPRQDRTLRMLPSVAIYIAGQEKGAPVAWTFLGVDSSLTTLHVEEEYRGRGLAKRLALKVLREHLGWYVRQYMEGEEVEERWAHADVAISNAPSNGVCKSLGGYTEWADYWFRADLNALQDKADN